MSHRVNPAAFVFAMLLSAAPVGARAGCEQQSGSGEVLGTLLGAAVGGLVGSKLGDGNGVAIGAGVLAGGFLGNRIGSALSCSEQQTHANTAQAALETQPSGSTSSWTNPDTGHSGTVTPTRTFQARDGTSCRDFEQTVTADGKSEQSAGTACRQPDGMWRMVSKD